jgi:hypothetical protein
MTKPGAPPSTFAPVVVLNLDTMMQHDNTRKFGSDGLAMGCGGGADRRVHRGGGTRNPSLNARICTIGRRKTIAAVSGNVVELLTSPGRHPYEAEQVARDAEISAQ